MTIAELTNKIKELESRKELTSLGETVSELAKKIKEQEARIKDQTDRLFELEQHACMHLSDLGHSVKRDVAPLYNFGLLIAGFSITIYSITTFRKHAKYTSYCMLISALVLQLVAAFDQVYGLLHVVVSILFFASLCLASIVYAVEGRSILALAAFITGSGSWMLYWGGIYSAGVAVPEIISSLATVSWVILYALRIYLGKLSR